jgi:hypothetical protein
MEETDKVVKVTIQNINMPFWAMVGLLVKIAIASIPALIILGVLSSCFLLLLSMLGIGLGSLAGQ